MDATLSIVGNHGAMAGNHGFTRVTWPYLLDMVSMIFEEESLKFLKKVPAPSFMKPNSLEAC